MRGTGHGSRRRTAQPLFLVLLLVTASSANGAVLLSQQQALAEAFPEAEVERLTAFLDQPQVRRIEELAGSEIESRVIIRYRGVREGGVLGTAYFDSHLVRTLPETLMIVVGPDGDVMRIEVLSFDEPPDYLPREKWFEQFDGRGLDPELSLKRGIRGVTGATLSSRAVTTAVRRALAIHRVLEEFAADEDQTPESGEEQP